jgi:hypothetical protein
MNLWDIFCLCAALSMVAFLAVWLTLCYAAIHALLFHCV